MLIQILTPAEEQLMILLWELNNFYLRDVMEKHPEPKPHQNTVSTYLKILGEKGFVSKTAEGRVHHYSASVSKNEYRDFLLNDLATKFFENDGKAMLNLLFEKNFLSNDDLLQSINFKIELKENKPEQKFEIADDILNEKKEKKKKKKKKKK